MSQPTRSKVWQIPLVLAALILFGLLAALLGNGAWKVLSWIAMATPLIVITWKLAASKK